MQPALRRSSADHGKSGPSDVLLEEMEIEGSRLKTHRIGWLLSIALSATSGCVRYEPQPLAATTPPAALPAVADLQTAVNSISHPLLRPLKIDLRDGLTPDSAALVAVLSNPALRTLRDQQALASAQLLQAGLLPNPVLDFSLDPVTGGNTAGAVTAYNLGLSYEVSALITHQAKLDAARAQNQSARLDVAWQEWQYAMAAKKAVYDVSVLREQLGLAATIDDRLRNHVELIRHAVAGHEKTLVDLAAADAASHKAHAERLVADHDLRQARMMLNQSLGLSPNADVRLAELSPLPADLVLPTEEELTAGLENRRLDLMALRLGYQSQEQTLRAAVLAQFPKVSLGIHQASDNTNVHSTGFGVTVDLPVFDQGQGTIAAEKATRQKLFDEYAARVYESRALIAQSLADIQSVAAQLRAAEEAMPAMQNLAELYQRGADQHNVDVLSVYAAQNDVAQQQVDLLRLKQQLLDNLVALELASGRYVPQPRAVAPAPASATAEAAR